MSWNARSRRLVAALVGLSAGLLPLPAAAVPDVNDDPAVQQAQQQLEAAAEHQWAVQVALDEAAARYEAALAHSYRLEAELAGADDRVAVVEESLETAEDRFAAQVRASYMRPGVATIRTVHAFLGAEDAPSALHQSALMAQVATVEAQRLETTRRVGALELEEVDNHVLVQAGAAAAEIDLAGESARLQSALSDAAELLADAEADLEVAEADAIRRAEEAAEAARIAAELAATANAWAALPAEQIIGGMACPIAQPNAFIDSWGFPRSGGRRHKGVDMMAAYGAPLYAVADGVVTRVFTSTLGGLSLDLVDGRGDRYYYAHLSAAYVAPGTIVRVGQVVGANGDSGNARGGAPHLHWQWHPGGGGPVNPYPLAAALCRR